MSFDGATRGQTTQKNPIVDVSCISAMIPEKIVDDYERETEVPVLT